MTDSPGNSPGNSLFVYGSFSEGLVHFNRIAEFVLNARSATVTGSMYRLAVGFPAFLANGSDTIRGQIVQLSSFDTLVLILDEFHGFSAKTPEKSLYQRLSVEVQLEQNQQTTSAWVYALNPRKLPKTAVPIPHGAWQQHLESNTPLTERLTERQKTYIQRLGTSSGRDIVPINLELYQELMSRELIVDKGRRLALSSLGREVFRFLS